MDSKEMEQSKQEQSILLFAGTTEGRWLAKSLQGLNISVYVSTATEYGKECVEGGCNIEVIAGRMDEKAITCFLIEHNIGLTVDATHPFAKAVTENIKNACKTCHVEYIRCLREEQTYKESQLGHVVFKDSVEEAVEYLQGREGKVFLTTGSKELNLYTRLADYKERCYVRVLSTKEAVEESVALGFQGPHLIAMQGPFSKELNVAMLKYTQAKYFVTKESGKNGGFQEKLEAAKEAGVILIVIVRPEENGVGQEETLHLIKHKYL